VQNIFGVLAHSLFAIAIAIAKRPSHALCQRATRGGAGIWRWLRSRDEEARGLFGFRRRRRDQYRHCRRASYKESVPLFVISSDIDTAASAKSPYSSFHGMEHVRLFRPITKQSASLNALKS